MYNSKGPTAKKSITKIKGKSFKKETAPYTKSNKFNKIKPTKAK